MALFSGIVSRKDVVGWIAITVLSLMPILLWLTMKPLSERIGSSYALLTGAGQILGLLGIVWYGLSFVLNSRIKALEPMFGGLNRVYVAHHILGGLAFIAILLHAAALAGRTALFSASQAAFFLLPSSDWPNNWGIISLWLTILLLVITFYIKLPYNIWLLTHKFLGLPFFFAGLHGLLITSDISQNAVLRIYILSIITLGLAAFGYRTLFGSILIRHYRYKIDTVNTLANSIIDVVASPLNTPLKFEAGQFVFVRFKSPHVSPEYHPFSISSAPQDGNVRLTMKILGDYSATLPKLTPGTIMEIDGAFGMFAHNSYRNLNQLWIGGGIGITPFLSMARSLAMDPQHKDTANVILIYSTKVESEQIGKYELSILESMVPGLRIIYHNSTTQGNVTAADILHQNPDTDRRDIYICGPPGMMKALRTQFNSFGIANNKIHTEEFSMR